MRKILSLLVAAVFVAGVSTAAFAQLGSNAYKAEVSFTGDSVSFAFALKRIATGNPKPASTDTAAALVDWAGVAGVAPQTNAFKNSRVYAEIVNGINKPGVNVYFFTDNMNDPITSATDTYKYTGAAANIPAMVEKNASTKVISTGPEQGLGLAYKVYRDGADDYNALLDVANIGFDKVDDGQGNMIDPYGVFYVTDKSKPGYNTGDALGYPKIACTEGTRMGRDATSWHFVPSLNGEKDFMFFSTNFASAKQGFSYGTNTLTVQVVQE